jgi:hypothetical protein
MRTVVLLIEASGLPKEAKEALYQRAKQSDTMRDHSGDRPLSILNRLSGWEPLGFSDPSREFLESPFSRDVFLCTLNMWDDSAYPYVPSDPKKQARLAAALFEKACEEKVASTFLHMLLIIKANPAILAEPVSADQTLGQKIARCLPSLLMILDQNAQDALAQNENKQETQRHYCEHAARLIAESKLPEDQKNKLVEWCARKSTTLNHDNRTSSCGFFAQLAVQPKRLNWETQLFDRIAKIEAEAKAEANTPPSFGRFT